MPKERKQQNTAAGLAVCCGMFLLLCIWGSAYHGLYYNAVSKDPVTVQGRVIDLGGRGAGMTYEYEFCGRRYEGQEVRRKAFCKWFGAPVDVVLSKSSPEMSTTNLQFLKSRSTEFAWGSAVALLLAAICAYFGIRYKRTVPVDEVNVVPRGQASMLTAFLAGFTLVLVATSIGMAQFSGEREWLRQASAVINQPNVTAEDRLQLVEGSINSRVERQKGVMPFLLAMLGGSFVVLIGASLYIGANRRQSLT